jgi:alpha-glucosidase
VIVDDDGELLPEGETSNRKATKYISRVTKKVNLNASNELFAKVVEEAHKRKIRVIIDGVFNHCGSFNKWLDREEIYKGNEDYADGAYISKDSPYHNFFHFFEDGEDKWPENGSYDGWWGFDTLPKLNYEGSKELEEYILGIGRKWVSAPYNADGWRLDVAADLGHSQEYNHEFWRKFRKAVKEANPDAIILAEHYGDPAPWLEGDQWDTVMNYDAFMEPITWFLTGMEKHSDEKNDNMKGNAGVFFDTMRYNMAKFHPQSLMVAMNELSNHDHSRFLTRTNGKIGRTATLGPEEAERGVSRAVMKEAVVMQMTWPGAPTIYYGDEAGVCGWTDPDNRRSYPWGREDLDLLEFHRDMIFIHRNNPALVKGSYVELHSEYNLIAYGRFYRNNKVVVAVNNSMEEKEAKINVYLTGIGFHANVYRIMETYEGGYNVGKLPVPLDDSGALSVRLKPQSAAVYVCNDEDPVIYCTSLNWD